MTSRITPSPLENDHTAKRSDVGAKTRRDVLPLVTGAQGIDAGGNTAKMADVFWQGPDTTVIGHARECPCGSGLPHQGSSLSVDSDLIPTSGEVQLVERTVSETCSFTLLLREVQKNPFHGPNFRPNQNGVGSEVIVDAPASEIIDRLLANPSKTTFKVPFTHVSLSRDQSSWKNRGIVGTEICVHIGMASLDVPAVPSGTALVAKMPLSSQKLKVLDISSSALPPDFVSVGELLKSDHAVKGGASPSPPTSRTSPMSPARRASRRASRSFEASLSMSSVLSSLRRQNSVGLNGSSIYAVVPIAPRVSVVIWAGRGDGGLSEVADFFRRDRSLVEVRGGAGRGEATS